MELVRDTFGAAGGRTACCCHGQAGRAVPLRLANDHTGIFSWAYKHRATKKSYFTCL